MACVQPAISGDFHQPVGEDGAQFGIGTHRASIGNAVTGLEVRDALTYFLNHPSTLHARREGQLRRRIEAAAEIDINEV